MTMSTKEDIMVLTRRDGTKMQVEVQGLYGLLRYPPWVLPPECKENEDFDATCFLLLWIAKLLCTLDNTIF